MTDDDLPRPGVDALWAGTLALMTVYAQQGTGPTDCPRAPIARKIASNLTALTGHPALSPPMRSVVHKALAAWDRIAVTAAPAATAAPAGTLH